MIEFINKFNYQKFNIKSFKRFINNFKDAEIVKKRRRKTMIRYVNIPCALDIECSSFYDANNEKTAIMYIWQLCINGICWYGRTYKEFWQMMNCIKDCGYGMTKRFIFYVHNLNYEFNCLHRYMQVGDYFAIEPRKPLYVFDTRGVEFRCSYKLSGYSLAYLGDKMLFKYHVKKAVGDLDYDLVRSPDTPITRREMGYCINDVRVVCNYIKEYMERTGGLHKLQLTKTGVVRKDLEKECLHPKGNKYYNKDFIALMKDCSIDSLDTYEELKEFTGGGFTHSNPINTGITFKIEDGRGIAPFDIASDYPFQLVVNKFPHGQPYKREYMRLEEYKQLVNDGFNVVARFKFKGLKNIFLYDYYISSSKCYDDLNIIESNGRVVSADKLVTTICELDFDIIEQTYTWSEIYIYDAMIYRSAYLPRAVVKTVLKYYINKTTLKGVKGREPEYMNHKEMLNSIYGCMLTDMVRPAYTYEDGNYNTEVPEVWKMIEEYNDKKSRTSAFIWGGYVTAYARQKLWNEAILPMAERYVYADTDSCYAIYDDTVKEHFKRVNDEVIKKLEYISNLRNIPLEHFMPETIEGVKKPLGVWETDEIEDFKTLGAKRYITRCDGKYKITVAGLAKSAVKYIESQGGFDYFNNYMNIPPEESGRLTVSYIDDMRKGELRDYKDNLYKYEVRCGVHMEKSSYTLSMNKLFLEYIKELLI